MNGLSAFFPGDQERAIGEFDVQQAHGPVADGRDDAARLVDLGAESLEIGVLVTTTRIFCFMLRPSHFLANVFTNFIARSIQPANCSSSSTPSGSTITQPFLGLPVMSNSLTFGSRIAPS